ncbi:MAG TPA: hypothetical protein DD379_08235 [Cyanobacteria bacterium UBA11162]|nr:hypothetical protein [Cyanobacteria bacterium UBA11162]
MEYPEIDSSKISGRIWDCKQGWLMPKFPDVPAKFLALCVNNRISGWSDWQVENKLIELGFQPSYRHLGANNPRDRQDATSLVFFIRKYRRNDPEMDAVILSLIEGGIPPRAILIITHRLYCSIMGLPMDRNDTSDDD